MFSDLAIFLDAVASCDLEGVQKLRELDVPSRNTLPASLLTQRLPQITLTGARRPKDIDIARVMDVVACGKFQNELFIDLSSCTVVKILNTGLRVLKLCLF